MAIFAIDTLWRDTTSASEDHWLGRTCKLYVLTADGFKMTIATLRSPLRFRTIRLPALLGRDGSCFSTIFGHGSAVSHRDHTGP